MRWLWVLAFVFSPSPFNKVEKASGPVVGTVLAHGLAGVVVDFEVVQSHSALLFYPFPEFAAEYMFFLALGDGVYFLKNVITDTWKYAIASASLEVEGRWQCRLFAVHVSSPCTATSAWTLVHVAQYVPQVRAIPNVRAQSVWYSNVSPG